MSLDTRIRALVGSIQQKFNSVTQTLTDKSDVGHKHAAADITSGTFSSARMPVASTILRGGTMYATPAEGEAGTSSTKAMTPASTKAAMQSFELSLRPSRPRAVFIGASNVVPGTWPEQLSADMGWIPHNFAVGGTAYGHGSPNTFEQQVIKARDSASFPNSEVGYVFIAGGGNDVRASYGATFNAATHGVHACYQTAKLAWPNARIIVIPVLWGAGGVHPYLWNAALVMENAAQTWGLEVIWHAWEWLMGGQNWMADAVHPNAAGYAEFIKYIKKYLRGESTAVNKWAPLLLESGIEQHSSGIARVVCIDSIVHLQARLIKPGGGRWVVGEKIATVPTWAAVSGLPSPSSTSGHNRGFTGGQNAYDYAAGFYIYPNGDLTIRGLEPTITSRNEANLGPVSWLIGS